MGYRSNGLDKGIMEEIMAQSQFPRQTIKKVAKERAVFELIKLIPDCEKAVENEVNEWLSIDKAGPEYSDNDIIEMA